MMQTLNPYTTTTTAKTAEIMARYRPIAPKPESPDQTGGETEKIRQSPYLRSVWSHLQARPTRTRKRGRTSIAPPPKRARSCLQGLSPLHITNSPAKNLSIQGFAHCPTQLCPISSFATTHATTLVTLPLLPCPSSLCITTQEDLNAIDLNKVAEIPEEKNLLAQLQKPTTTTTTNTSNVISPRPIRLVGSSISIWDIKDDPTGSIHELQVLKKADEVEEELESEALPTVVSDSNNKVRLVNSAYKEMVGQPECPWLDSMIINGGDACKRICGKVMLQFLDDPDVGTLVSSSDGFSCWARIEWGTNGNKTSVDAFCEAMRLFLESKDYLFAWRFHTREASESASNV